MSMTDTVIIKNDVVQPTELPEAQGKEALKDIVFGSVRNHLSLEISPAYPPLV